MDPADIKRIIREHSKKLHNLDEIEQFFGNHKPVKLT